MSAITPHLEEQDDPSESPAEEAWFNSHYAALEGLGALEYDPEGMGAGLANKALQVSHSNLITTAWTRRVMEEALVGRTLTVTTKGRDVVIHLDQPIGVDPRFNPPGTGKNQNFRLLGWTSKMGAPSFSLPAGPPQYGGSCPGALAGQSIVPERQLVKASRAVSAVIQEDVVLPDAVCQWCYAEGGNYRYGTKQLAQVVLFLWSQHALQDDTFVEVMDWAVKNADYKLAGDATGLPPERHPGKFFRIHDSGDFFSRRYLEAWKRVADRNPDVTFWAPTRLWAVPQGVGWVNEINDPPGNLVIRPSAYMVDRPQGPDLGPGWAKWSVVYDETNKPQGGPLFAEGPYNWDCQAYAVVDEAHNCRYALSPDGEVGCRACWIRPDFAVNYTKH